MDEHRCELHRGRMTDAIKRNEIRINNHGDRIDRLEQEQARTITKIDNLVDQIKSLVSVVKWFMGLAGGTLVGFFIWYIQRL